MINNFYHSYAILFCFKIVSSFLEQIILKTFLKFVFDLTSNSSILLNETWQFLFCSTSFEISSNDQIWIVCNISYILFVFSCKSWTIFTSSNSNFINSPFCQFYLICFSWHALLPSGQNVNKQIKSEFTFEFQNIRKVNPK